jgi:hypothetical protein
MASRTPSRPPTPAPRPALPGFADRLRSWADDFRRADRFFKMRVSVVGTWILLSLVTLWAACPSSGPSNSLGADVQVLRESLVGGEQLLVRNESSDIWTDVVLTLDEGWRYEHRTMRPHDQLVLPMSHFRKDDTAAPRDFKPRTLTIRCGQGRASFDLK